MRERTSAGHCLRAGLAAFLRSPLPLILGWAVSAGITILFIVYIPRDLSSALQIGAAFGGFVLTWPQLRMLRSMNADIAAAEPSASSPRSWVSALIALAIAPTLYRVLTWAIWYAVPLSGALMYAFVTFGAGNMYVSGRLDLLTSAILFGFGTFALMCGLVFAPLCAVLDRIGPFASLKRSWRMVSGHRATILRIATATLGAPVALSLAAYYVSVLQTAQATFRGLPAVLWSIALGSVVLFLGPWLTAAITLLFIPLKEEENFFTRRLRARRVSMDLS